MEQNAPKPAVFFSFFRYICSFLLVLLTTNNLKALAASPPILSPSSSSSSSLVCNEGTNDSNSMEAVCRVEAADEPLQEMVLMADDGAGTRRRFVQERATQKYITPGALKRDKPVCNGGSSGEAYSSSCLPPPSNPHTRGCFKYYRCRSDS